MYKYAQINDQNIVIGVTNTPYEIITEHMIDITEIDDDDLDILLCTYDIDTKLFHKPPKVQVPLVNSYIQAMAVFASHNNGCEISDAYVQSAKDYILKIAMPS